jgi:hypothetical protein
MIIDQGRFREIIDKTVSAPHHKLLLLVGAFIVVITIIIRDIVSLHGPSAPDQRPQ